MSGWIVAAALYTIGCFNAYIFTFIKADADGKVFAVALWPVHFVVFIPQILAALNAQADCRRSSQSKQPAHYR